MRIRRYAKLAVAGVTAQTPATVSGASDTLVCQLNRSPWDVISFVAESHPKNIKEEEGEEGREEEMADNGRISPKKMKLAIEWKDENHEKDEILCRKTGSKGWKCRKEAKQGYSLCEHHLELKRYSRKMSRRKSVTVAGECRRKQENMVEVKEDKLVEVKEVKLVELKEEKDENSKKEEDGEKEKNLCRKSGSKGWKCRREAKEGHTLCEHHLSLKCYYRQESCQKSEVTTGKCRRSCNRKLLSSTTSEFYFYSGFGPRWRRRRGSESGDEASTAPPAPPPPPPSSSSSPSPLFMDAHEHAHLDNHDHNDNEEEKEKRVDCKKRKRKPMKARSLKSIL